MKRIEKVRIEVSGMNNTQTIKAETAAKMVLSFFQSDFFKKKINLLNGEKLRGETSSSIYNKVTNDQLYNLFMTGKEEWNEEIDYEIDLVVSRYTKTWSKVVGYIIPMKPSINVNSKYFDTMSVTRVASNFCHEWAHTLGMRHGGKYLKESLTYLINKWVEEFFSKDVPIDDIKKTLVCKRTWYTLWLGKKCYIKIIK